MKETKTRWRIRLFNVIASSKAELDPDRLIKAAKQKSKLANLGTVYNHEPLTVLCKSITEEAQLHPFGTFMIKQKLIGQLEGRLWAEHWFDKHPEILEQELLPVVMITGLQRTGTTKLQRLLSDSAGARGLRSWEGLYPAPIGNKSETLKRVNRTKLNEKAVRWISPSFYGIHPIEHNNYEEDVLLLDLDFMSSSSEAIMHVPSYAAYLDQTDQTSAYNYEIKLLKLLQWQKPGDYWVLKSPHHLEYLDIANRLISDLKLVWTHRDPKATIPSYMSMLYHGRRMFSQEVIPESITNHWLPKIDRMLKKGLNDVQQLSQVRHINFEDLVTREEQTMNSLTNWIGCKARAHGSASKSYSSRHHYQLEDWGLTADELDQRFQDYLQAMKAFTA